MNLKEKTVNLLATFEQPVYHRLYEFLSLDHRAKLYSNQSQYVDGAMTLKNEHYPEYLVERLTENDIAKWNIDIELLYGVLSGNMEIEAEGA